MITSSFSANMFVFTPSTTTQPSAFMETSKPSFLQDTSEQISTSASITLNINLLFCKLLFSYSIYKTLSRACHAIAPLEIFCYSSYRCASRECVGRQTFATLISALKLSYRARMMTCRHRCRKARLPEWDRCTDSTRF